MKAPQKVDPRWIWHNRTLLALRRKLIRLRDEHRLNVSAPMAQEDRDHATQANELAEREVENAELRTEGTELAEIEAALQRVRDGTYGICTETGRPISAARLRAVPWTPYSRDAALRLEVSSKKRG